MNTEGCAVVSKQPEQATPVAGPFAGLRVIEIGRFIAVPYCGQLLADGGADVIKVEPPQGDESRINTPVAPGEGRQFLNKNRGKRSIALRLSDPLATTALQRLCASADVVLVNLRPGQADEYGIDWPRLHAQHPRLIYADVTAFGPKGPDAGLPGMDHVVQPRSGLAAALNVVHEGMPNSAPLPLVDYYTALLLAWGVSTALYARERTGRGQRVETSLLQGALVAQNNVLTDVMRLDSWRQPLVDWLQEARREGVPYEEQLDRRLRGRPAGRGSQVYMRSYQTADGFISIAAGTLALQRRAIAVLGIEDPRLQQPDWSPDDGFVYLEEQMARTQGALLDDTTAGWLDRLRAVGVPAAPVCFPEEMYDDPQVTANDFVTTLDHPTLGPVRVVAPPVRLSDTPLIARRPPPRLGEHTRELLAEVGLQAAALLQRGAALTADAAPVSAAEES